MRTIILTAALWTGFTSAHLAAWHKGMYCLNVCALTSALLSFSDGVAGQFTDCIGLEHCQPGHALVSAFQV